jgi:hypothetical protein
MTRRFEPDAQARDAAARIQGRHPAWMVMWSCWRRQFTAIGRLAPVPVILDEADPRALLQAMRAEELRHAHPDQ